MTTEDVKEAATQENSAEKPENTAQTQHVNSQPATTAGNMFDPSNLGILNDVSILLTIEIGRAQIKIKDLLNLTKDSIIDLNKLAGEPVDIYANGKLISKGNIITANGKYCVRLTTIPEKNQL